MLKLVLTSKPVIAALVCLGLMVPLALIDDLIVERKGYRDLAIDDVTASWTGSQTVTSPILVIAYSQHKTQSVWSDDLGRVVEKPVTTNHTAFIPLKTLVVDVDVATEVLYRGLHGVPVYTAVIHLEGTHDPELLPDVLKDDRADISVTTSWLWIAVSDQRGFADFPTVNWAGQALEATAGGHPLLAGRGLRVSLDLPSVRQPASMDMRLSLRGAHALNFLPAAHASDVHVSSDWAHPRFSGRFLPHTREVSENGFEASWRNTVLSSNITADLAHCSRGDCGALVTGHFGVEFVEPVNEYRQTERAMKYALLFILIVLASVLFTELARSLDVHPLQYGLIGAAMAMFYLLLLSLSEHLPFLTAYAIATALNTALLTWYGINVLRSTRHGIVFGIGITTLYGILLLILQAEDTALLMGTLLTFAMLVGMMAVTRNTEWLSTFRLTTNATTAD